MSNEELINALRYCAEHDGCDYYIAKDCLIGNTWVCGADCEQTLMLDAADALETAENRIADLETALKACRVQRGEKYDLRFNQKTGCN